MAVVARPQWLRAGFFVLSAASGMTETKTRRAIIGGPRTGKSTMSKQYGNVCCGDDHIDKGWSEASDHIAGLMHGDKHETYEGTSIVRALRKALDQDPRKKPVDEVVYLRGAKVKTTPGQDAMSKAVDTIFREIEPKLRRLGVKITMA